MATLRRLLAACALSAAVLAPAASFAQPASSWSPLVCFWNVAKCENVQLTEPPRPDVPLTWTKEDRRAVNPQHVKETADNWYEVGKHDLGDGTYIRVWSDGTVRRYAKQGADPANFVAAVFMNGKTLEAPRGYAYTEATETKLVAEYTPPQPVASQPPGEAGDKVWNGREWSCKAGMELYGGNSTQGACVTCEKNGKVWNGFACVCPPGFAYYANQCYPTKR